mmetsp:Transcript_20628/g.43594  ORF Transcript_20628/g.43594 Transcript_20628/m.43594 type:complete len:576 (+) Transcript_20628:2-1729(+)
MSIELLSIGVVTMFVTAGILIHSVFLAEYDDLFVVPIFWSCIAITSTVLLFMKFSEDRKEKKKEGVYDVSWQDESSFTTGPYAKIDKSARELSSSAAVALGSLERVESFGRQERMEREFCTKSQLLHRQAESLRRESVSRTNMRNEVLQLLTTAAEELDALPEELISRTNKILHSIDEADVRTASLVTTQLETENSQEQEKYHVGLSRVSQSNYHLLQAPPSQEKIGAHPIDAQRIPVSLGSLRKKLGEISHTTLLRLRNTSNEPLRLKSGVQLKEGRYIKSINANDPHGNAICFHLYPGTEIPPRTEVLVVSRSSGAWFPTSGIAGKIIYTNYDGSWTFEISFRNDLIGNVRRCRVKAYPTNGTNEDLTNESKQYWEISKDEYDGKVNSEILISFDVLRGARGLFRQLQSTLILKSAFLLVKKLQFGLGIQWHQRWCVLTPIEIIFSKDEASEKQDKILLKDITKVHEDGNLLMKNIFQIHTNVGDKGPHRLATKSIEERDDWIKKIQKAVERISETPIGLSPLSIPAGGFTESSSTASGGDDSPYRHLVASPSYVEDGIECVHRDKKTEILTL